MARTRRIKPEGEAYFHVTSRITGRQFLLRKNRLKAALLDAIERAASFSGVDIAGFCIMDDHFHLVCHIPGVPAETIPDEEVLERVEKIKGLDRCRRLRARLRELEKNGDSSRRKQLIDRYRKRMYDISQFVKTFKEMFSLRFRAETGYVGYLWAGRFKSVLIEDGRHLAVCAKYVEMNPVRAKMVAKAVEYQWNTSGAAQNGSEFARKCLECLRRLHAGGAYAREWMQTRHPQLSNGKILGGEAFVLSMLRKFGAFLQTSRPGAKLAICGIYTSHGCRSPDARRKLRGERGSRTLARGAVQKGASPAMAL